MKKKKEEKEEERCSASFPWIFCKPRMVTRIFEECVRFLFLYFLNISFNFQGLNDIENVGTERSVKDNQTEVLLKAVLQCSTTPPPPPPSPLFSVFFLGWVWGGGGGGILSASWVTTQTSGTSFQQVYHLSRVARTTASWVITGAAVACSRQPGERKRSKRPWVTVRPAVTLDNVIWTPAPLSVRGHWARV